MQKAKILRNEQVVVAQGRFVMEIKAFEVPVDRRFPNGVKLRRQRWFPMKNETMTVEFKSLVDMESDLLSLHKKKRAKTQPKTVVYFDSLGSFRNFLTIQNVSSEKQNPWEAPMGFAHGLNIS